MFLNFHNFHVHKKLVSFIILIIGARFLQEKPNFFSPYIYLVRMCMTDFRLGKLYCESNVEKWKETELLLMVCLCIQMSTFKDWM